jgi:hypothetical protein
LDFKIEIGDSLTAPNPQAMPDLFRSVLIQHADRLAQLKGRYLRAYGEEKRRLERQIKDEESQLRDALRDSPAPPVALDWRIAFAEVFAEKQGFDIVLANPPYVRQELIPQAYKQLLLSLYPDAAEGRSDLYVYFYARALQLLRPSGIHVFICSNSWLDVAYGGKLQKHLLENAHILAIYESALERQFTSAAINTIISFMRKGRPDDAAETRFIRLLDAFEKSVTDPSRQRIVVKTRAELWQEGSDESGRYVGNKWGGKYLRAPDIFFTILEKGRGKLVPLGEIAEVRRGFTTGANEFFYLQPVGMSVKDVAELAQRDPEAVVEVKNGFGWEGKLEAIFLKPMLFSLKETPSVRPDPERFRYCVFCCPLTQQDLNKRGYKQALAYVKAHARKKVRLKHGGECLLPQVPSLKGREPWYSLPVQQPPHFIANRFWGDRFVFLEGGDFLVCDVFFVGYLQEPEQKTVVVALLNSTLTALIADVIARKTYGIGVAYLYGPEINGLPIPNPAIFSPEERCRRLVNAFELLSQRPVRSIFEELGFELCRKRRCDHPEHPYEQVTPEALTLEQVQRASPDRFELDAVIFDVLGLTDDERLAVYKSVAQLVKDRLVKARSV